MRIFKSIAIMILRPSISVIRFLLRFAWARWCARVALKLILHIKWLCRIGSRILASFPDMRTRLALIMGPSTTPTPARDTASQPIDNKSTVRKYFRPTLKDNAANPLHRQKPYRVTALTTGQTKAIYYWIDHTTKVQTNTGMQQVTRCLARGLMENNNKLIFVCWNEENNTLVKATRTELEYLSCYNGPGFTNDLLASYAETPEALHEKINPEELDGSWLIIPEVTHITHHKSPPTLDVIDYAKAFEMKTAFVFYDAIPLKLEEYAASAGLHADYMQHISLADAIIPISVFASKDLENFYKDILHFSTNTMPVIKPVLLPGQCYDSSRVTTPNSSEDELLILSLGTIEPRKNQTALLKAFQNLCDRYPDTRLKLVLCGNLDPRISPILHEAIKKNNNIEYAGYADDKKLTQLYERCSFTVFPSLEEGFGLPIIESLWHGKPVICANFGSMAEAAQGGGCLTIDVRSINEIEKALERMAFDKEYRTRLASEATSKSISSWQDYAREVFAIIKDFDDPAHHISKIYYWVDHTSTYHGNSGIQRVTRGLARALQQTNIPLIPVKWDSKSRSFYRPDEKELEHLSKWNGPVPEKFSGLSISDKNHKSWLIIPELTTYQGGPDLKIVVNAARNKGLQTAIIFHDALPYKLTDMYSPEAAAAHKNYMETLPNFDLIFPNSVNTCLDLRMILFMLTDRVVNLEVKSIPILLPGELIQHPRVLTYKEPESEGIKILSVGTIEPRKNHLVLLESFEKISSSSSIDMELVLVGNCPFPGLEKEVNGYMARNKNIHWLHDIDDTILAKEYTRCHFTVYPSREEGFGLPILESLWYGRPCICRNAGAMLEAAEGGGCLTVDTTNAEKLAEAMLRLATDKVLRASLGKQAVTRHIKTWAEYAREILYYLEMNTDA